MKEFTDTELANEQWRDVDGYYGAYNNIHLRHKTYIHTQPKRDKVKDLYDTNLTYQQNIEIFRANGIECSGGTIYRLRKELGLTKTD